MSLTYRADPRLSRFDPLERIIFYDDFDEGIRGWSELIGNYEHTLDSMLPEYSDMRPPMLSNLTMWDTGSAGSMEGDYALKLASRAREGLAGDQHQAADLPPPRPDSTRVLLHLQAGSERTAPVAE